MDYYFVTGSSKGLGKALVELLLKEESNFVYGYARSGGFKHERYVHTSIDLRDVNALKDFNFPTLENPGKIVLINNAGIVGSINHVGKLDNQKIIDSYQLNLIAPAIMSNNFLAKYGAISPEKIIVNISSGAGRTPIDGWSVYCSTKAGVDMFSEVLKDEIDLNHHNVKVLSLAPGIIDTEMQDEIRTSEESGFSNIDRFIAYKKEGELTNAAVTAKQVIRFVTEQDLQKDVICSVRDL